MVIANRHPGLEGVSAKLERAEELVRTLRHEVETLVERHSDPVRTERSVDGLIDSVFFNIEEVPPLRLSLVISDALHNMRSSLDHLVYALCTKGEPLTEKIAKQIEFPIYLNADDFARDRVKKIGRAPANAQVVIEELQPYNGTLGIMPFYEQAGATNPAEQQPLWVLNRLSNIDKHRTLYLTYHSIKGAWGPSVGTLIPMFGGRRIEYGTEIGRVEYRTPPGSGELDVQFVPDVVVEEPVAGVWYLSSEIGYLASVLSQQVVPRFVEFF